MKLKKLSFILGLFVLALAGIAWVYYKSWRNESQQSTTLPDIPQSAALVYELESAGKQWAVFQQTDLVQDLACLPVYASIQKSLHWLEGIGIDRSTLDKLPMVCSIHGLSEEELGYIFYFPIQAPSTQALLQLLPKLKQDPTYQIEETSYTKHRITIVHKLGTSQKLHFIQQGSHIIASFSLVLLEDLIRGLAQKVPNTFLPIQQSTNKKSNLYINFSQMPLVLRTFLEKEVAHTWGGLVANFASLAQLELKVTNHYLLLNGFTSSLDTIPYHRIHALAGQESGPFDLVSYIPQSATVLQHIRFKEAQSLATAWQQYRQRQSNSTQSQEPLPNVSSNSLGALLNPLLNAELGLCTLGLRPKEQLLFLRTHHTEAFIAALQELHLLTKSIYKAPKQHTAPVYELAPQAFIDWLPGQLFPDFQPRLLTTIDNYIVLADSKSALEKLINQYSQGHTWANTHKAFLSSLLDQAHYSVLINLQQAWPQIIQAMKPSWKAFFNQHASQWQHFNQASLQVIPDKSDSSSHYLSLIVQHAGQKSAPKAAHQDTIVSNLHPFKAEAPITTKPFIVPTHKPDGSLIIFQDALHQVYCLNKKGKLLWKKATRGPIVGRIFAIDFYKNNRWQYLWATADGIYLVDYHGKSVGNYPHKLPQASGQVALNVIDYQQDKNYRLLLADTTGNIYLKDSQYRPLPGWNPKALGQAFAGIPLHIRLKNDYFLVLQQNGRLQALNRKGQNYPGFPVDLKGAIHNPLVIKKGNSVANTLLVTLTDAGQLSRHSLAGILQNSIQLDKPTTTTQFILCPDEVTGSSYVILRQDLDRFALLDEAGKVLFEKEHKAAQPLLCQYYHLGKHQFYVVTDQGQHISHIYDGQGNAINVAPLPNSQRVSLYLTAGNTQLLVYSNFKDQTLQYVLPLE
jgi:hypothetical protein